jgi:hypothetical protein
MQFASRHIIAISLAFSIFATSCKNHTPAQSNDSANPKKHKTTLDEMSLKGEVKMIREEDYSISSVEMAGVSKEQKSLEQKVEYHFNKKGYLTKIIKTDDSKIVWTNQLIYDPQDRKTDDKLYMNDKLTSREAFTYDANGFLASCAEYNFDASQKEDVLLYKITYINDSTGRILKEKRLRPDNVLTSSNENKYDGRGRLVEVIHTYYKQDTTTERELIKYDSLTTERSIFDAKGALIAKSVKKCDSTGFVTEQHEVRDDGKVVYSHNTRYNLDKAKNWIRSMDMENKAGKEVPTHMIERAIEYY